MLISTKTTLGLIFIIFTLINVNYSSRAGTAADQASEKGGKGSNSVGQGSEAGMNDDPGKDEEDDAVCDGLLDFCDTCNSLKYSCFQLSKQCTGNKKHKSHPKRNSTTSDDSHKDASEAPATKDVTDAPSTPSSRDAATEIPVSATSDSTKDSKDEKLAKPGKPGKVNKPGKQNKPGKPKNGQQGICRLQNFCEKCQSAEIKVSCRQARAECQ